jgi:hypothetical protein
MPGYSPARVMLVITVCTMVWLLAMLQIWALCAMSARSDGH